MIIISCIRCGMTEDYDEGDVRIPLRFQPDPDHKGRLWCYHCYTIVTFESLTPGSERFTPLPLCVRCGQPAGHWHKPTSTWICTPCRSVQERADGWAES
jgi:hypothetical protein